MYMYMYVSAECDATQQNCRKYRDALSLAHAATLHGACGNWN